LPRLITILGDAIWYAFLVGFLFMIIGVAASFLLASQTPTSAATRNSTEPKVLRREH